MSLPWAHNRKDIGDLNNTPVPVPSKLSLPRFSPPRPPSQIDFTVAELAGSMARCNALSSASAALLWHLQKSAEIFVASVVDDDGSYFCIENDAMKFGDARLTSFSHDIGVGLANLYMERMGYRWRANAKEWIYHLVKKPDYFYDDGSGNSLIAAMEAKGSVSNNVPVAAVDSRTCTAYADQVEGHLGEWYAGLQVAHGYAIGTSARAGDNSSKMYIYETEHPSRGRGAADGSAPDDRRSPAGPIALSNYGSLFLAMGAYEIARRAGSTAFPFHTDFETGPEVFLAGSFRGTRFLFKRLTRPWILAIEFSTGKRFIDALQDGLLKEMPAFELPLLDRAGFLDFPTAAMFGDGFALLPVSGLELEELVEF